MPENHKLYNNTAIFPDELRVDAALRETKTHGTKTFPIATYENIFNLATFNQYLHWHSEMEITYILKGSATFRVNLDHYIVSEGEFIITPPNVLHSVEHTHSLPTHCMTCVFDLNMLMSGLADDAFLNYFSPFLEHTLVPPLHLTKALLAETDFEKTFHALILALQNAEATYSLEVKSYLFHLFALLFSPKFCQETPTINLRKNKTITTLKNVLSYVMLYYAEPLTITQLAQVAGYSDYHFMRFFKQHMGITCNDYLQQVRLENAVTLLEQTNKSITDIAYACGFESDSYFIKCFKKRYLKTPLSFRSQKGD